MGRLKKQGQVGAISGKVGDVVMSEWKDIPTVRSRSKKSSKPASQGQQEQRTKMAKVVDFATAIKKVLALGFNGYANKMSGYNAGVSDILEYAVTGEMPNYSINYAQVRVTLGRLANEGSPAVKVEDGKVVFTWVHEDAEGVETTDKAILVVYCPATGNSLYTLNGPTRTAGTGSIAVGRFKGQEVHTWLAFVSADGLVASTSTYTGKLAIP
jgi:hypothetical protein